MTHTTSLELSKRLKSVGVLQISMFMWTQTYTRKSGTLQRDSKPFIQKTPKGKTYPQDYSAFLASELAEILPEDVSFQKRNGKYRAISWTPETKEFTFEADTLEEAMGEMVYYLAKEGLIKF